MSSNLSAASQIAGFLGACLLDSESGLMLASEGGGKIDLEVAAAHSAQVIKAKLQTIEMLGLHDEIEEILVTLRRQIHMIRPLERTPGVFLYVALEQKGANLGMARIQVKKIASSLTM